MPPLTPDQSRLAAEYFGHAIRSAGPWRSRYPRWADDFDSAAGLALVGAVANYHPVEGVPFEAFLRVCVRSEIFDTLRRLSRRGRPGVESLGDLDPPDPDADAIDPQADLDAWVRRLPRRHAEFCRSYYLGGGTLAEAGSRVGIGGRMARLIHSESLRWLRAELAESAR